MQVDTGATVSIISETWCKTFMPHKQLEETFMDLRTYSEERIVLIGKTDVEVKYKEQSVVLPVVVTKGSKAALLGRNWLKVLKLDWASLFQIKSLEPLSLKEVLVKHKKIFEVGLGTIKNFKAQIKMKPDISPKFHKARPVPYSLKQAVELEQDRLEKAGIISKIESSNWAAPIVVVPKGDQSLRICGDYKITVNQSIEEEQYPLPTAEDLVATLAGGRLFTKLDLSHAYQQLELDEKSKQYLVVNTHKGLYCYNRLSYGVSSAPAIFQLVMDQILQGLEHVTCFLDDILITAKTAQQHLQILDAVLSRLEQYGIRVKQAKCSFMQESVEYLGHQIDKDGLHPTKEKVSAILEAPEPKNIGELRSFLGLLNYYGRFLARLSTVLQPLHELLQNDKTWDWSSKCKAAFNQCK
ncbi:uncharacterized protein K02A2.6-like [Polypterus senegalus]|uniref:uncharacterized protein K02A2.6-like n=1 Tax=Polypterus senegalus TaxID=55291 RepID=UPI00196664F8|nr:uncharacterized protein K02A2.6-like [Polypterus senegalus]